jgi:hypothetical protein
MARVSSKSIKVRDAELVKFGDSDDVALQWDGTNLLVAAAADDSLIEVGDSASTQKSFDVKVYGNAANGADRLFWDASASRLSLVGAANIGETTDTYSQVVFQSRNTVAYTDTAAKNLFQIPANADIVGITVNVTTAFDDTGTDLLDIGKTGTGNFFKNDLDVSSAGQTVTGWSNFGDVGASAITVTATYIPQTPNAAAGAATIIFFWTKA